MKKRILSLMLCVVMLICIGYQPSLAMDSEDAATPTDAATQTDAAIQTDAVMPVSSSAFSIVMGTEGISGYDSAKGYDYVYFGSWESSGAIKWRVLDDKTNTGENGLFLLSDSTLGTRISFDKTSPYSNTWQGSDAQSWCSSFYATNLTTREQGAVLETTKSDEEFTCTNGYKFSASTNILSGDKVFFLSAEETENRNYGYAHLSTNRDACWLRSPVADRSDGVGIVTYAGNVTTISTEYAFAARPAFNLNTSPVLFTSDAVGGKEDEAVDESLTAVGTGTGEWKLTLNDASRNSFTASTNSNGVNYEGYSDWTMDVSYEHAQTGDNEYVSAMIVDKNGTILYYGRIANNSVSGTAKVTIPAGLTPGSYTLKVFSEQCNGDKQTDYASDFQNISLTVSNTYTVSFNANGGSGDMPDVTRVSGKYTLPECVFTAPDDTMEFEEWLVNEVPYNPGESITVSGNVIVKAVWKKITYFITITDKSGNTVQITPSNCHDVLGDGTVSYTPPTVDNTKSYTNEEIEKVILGESVEGITPAVLTLNNANLRQIYFENFYLPSGADPAAKATANLFRFPIVKLEGENTIINEYKVGIRVYVGMIITGDGSLTINTNGSSAIAYGVGGLYLQKSGTVTLNAYSRGIYQGEPIYIWFQGGKLTIQAGNSEDESSGAIAMFDGFSMADNVALWLGDSAETNCIPITPPNDAENWQDAIIRQWRMVGSENYKAHYLQLTTTYTVTLNVEGGTIADGKNVTGYTYGEGVALPSADDVTYDGYTFKGWYAGEDLTGSPVTAIGDTETGDREYWAKWEDSENPVISGLTNDKTYCGMVEFEVSDNEGIAGVKADDEDIAPGANGKYTLAAGAGAVTVAATDYTGNTTRVNVNVNDGHTDADNDHICDICKAVTNHNLERVPAKAATTAETGNIEYWRCDTQAPKTGDSSNIAFWVALILALAGIVITSVKRRKWDVS